MISATKSEWAHPRRVDRPQRSPGCYGCSLPYPTRRSRGNHAGQRAVLRAPLAVVLHISVTLYCVLGAFQFVLNVPLLAHCASPTPYGDLQVPQMRFLGLKSGAKKEADAVARGGAGCGFITDGGITQANIEHPTAGDL